MRNSTLPGFFSIVRTRKNAWLEDDSSPFWMRPDFSGLAVSFRECGFQHQVEKVEKPLTNLGRICYYIQKKSKSYSQGHVAACVNQQSQPCKVWKSNTRPCDKAGCNG